MTSLPCAAHGLEEAYEFLKCTSWDSKQESMMCSDIIKLTDFNNCVFVCTILQDSVTIVKCDFDIVSKSKAIPQKHYQARSTYLDLCKKNVNTFL